MPTDLERTRDHARKMAAFIDPRDASGRMSGYCQVHRNVYGDPILEARHDECTERECSCDCHPREEVSDRDRDLWTRLADEIDAYLTPELPAYDDSDQPLEEHE